MGLISRIRGLFSGEGKAVEFSSQYEAAILGGYGLPSNSGETVSLNTALRTMPFYRGIVIIAEGIAQLPVQIYKTSGRGAEPAVDHPLYDVLLHQTNGLQDSFQFFRTMLMHAAASGNGVAYRVVLNGQVRELIPVRPECVTIDIDRFYNRTYDMVLETGDLVKVGQRDVFHIAGPSWRPFTGMDPVTVGREALGLAQATEKTHASLHKNGVRTSGILSTDQKLTKEQVDVLREQWRQKYAGAGNVGETPVLGGGLKWQDTQMKGVDAEHLDTRKHQIEEIARLLGLFPIMLGHAGDQSPTFASAEAFFAAHVRHSLQPWVKSLVKACDTQLLTPEERREGYHVRIDTSELMRGSLKDRAEYYTKALGDNNRPGWLSPDEVREDDGWNPKGDAKMEEVWQPVTTMAAGGEPQPSGPQAKSAAPRTLYVSRKLLNAAEFTKWAKSQGFSDVQKDLHVTIAYSKTRVDWMIFGEDFWQNQHGELLIPPGGPRVVEPIGDDGAVALKFESRALEWRFERFRELGASWDYSEYQPHITITWNAQDVDLTKVQPYQGELKFGPEIFEEINENWQDKGN